MQTVQERTCMKSIASDVWIVDSTNVTGGKEVVVGLGFLWNKMLADVQTDIARREALS